MLSSDYCTSKFEENADGTQFLSSTAINNGKVDVKMTLTAAGCGMGPYIAQQAEWAISELDEVEDVNVDIVFEPPWDPEKITEDGKKLLGID